MFYRLCLNFVLWRVMCTSAPELPCHLYIALEDTHKSGYDNLNLTFLGPLDIPAPVPCCRNGTRIASILPQTSPLEHLASTKMIICIII